MQFIQYYDGPQELYTLVFNKIGIFHVIFSRAIKILSFHMFIPSRNTSQHYLGMAAGI